jgi:ABC-2 type transport system ATP-binding protein
LIGIVFGGERGLYMRLSARTNLEYWGALYQLSGAEIKSRSTALLERVGSSDVVMRAGQRDGSLEYAA